MAVACSTGAFRMPLQQALQEIAQLGFTCVDLICIPAFNQIMPAELAADFDRYAGDVVRWVNASGLTPVAVNTAFGDLYQRKDPAQNEQRRKEVTAVTRLMNLLGVKVASLYPGSSRPVQDRAWEQVLADEVITLYEVMAIADRAGVAFAVELHVQTPFETVAQGQRLLDAVPELKVAYDPSHFVMQGIPLPQTRFALDRAAHVHLRDAAPGKMQEACGRGTVDFDWLLDALAGRHYQGHFSIEYLPDLGEDVHDQILKVRERIQTRKDGLPRRL